MASIANPRLREKRPSADNILMCAGLRELVERYDAFCLDQYGVLHDGESAYPEVAACLEQLHAAGKPCVIVSNYSGRSSLQQAKLPQLGLNPEHVSGIVTSGELAHNYLARQSKLGKRVLWISWPSDDDRGLGTFFDDLEGYTLVTDADEADFIFVSGVGAIFAGTEAEIKVDFERDGKRFPFTKYLRRCINRAKPMLCANPDKMAVRPGGWTAHLPGRLAKQYEELGGRVMYFGKPNTAAFEQAITLVEEACYGDSAIVSGSGESEPPAPLRICHVGDSLSHDIKGAHMNGLDCAFVVETGIHAKEVQDQGGLTAMNVEYVCRNNDAVDAPTAVVPRFAW